jgi:peptide chain release factor subunit 3
VLAAQQQPSKAVAAKKAQVEKAPETEKLVKAKVVKDIVVKVDEEEIVQVETAKEPCSMVFIGHVDAGKSTISGQIMLQMGCIDERTIAKYKQEAKDKGRDSWWLAYVMDVGEEEKAKGKTVEVGRATFSTELKQFTVFDAPGHKNYVPNMIMGAALADFGGLVISARRGEYEAGFEKDG